ncbi:MAG: hypothetical protein V1909_04345 [Candidatus Micrarchaeota archaeon]
MTIVNFHLQGELEKKVKRFIRAGYATSKAEVIRSALSSLHEPQAYEDISDDPDLGNYLKGIRGGKIKPKFIRADSNIKKLLR